MIFTKEDRERAERIETTLTSLRLDVGMRGNPSPLSLHLQFGDLASGFDKLMQSQAALDRNFELLKGWVQSRIKPLSEEEKVEWAKNILFSIGYVPVKMEDASSARQGLARSTAEKPKPRARSHRK